MIAFVSFIIASSIIGSHAATQSIKRSAPNTYSGAWGYDRKGKKYIYFFYLFYLINYLYIYKQKI